jgi:hypothetical protein
MLARNRASLGTGARHRSSFHEVKVIPSIEISNVHGHLWLGPKDGIAPS